MRRSPATTPDVSIILPCAGFGTRFGAPYSKELHCLAPGVTVLDRSLEAAVELAESGLRVRVVVVIAAHKLDTVAYLTRYAGTFHVVFVYQDESFEPGLEGAIRSALPLARGPVVLVLPDIVISGAGSAGCLVEALRRTRVAGWSVVAAEERDPDVLRHMGALAVVAGDAGMVVEAAADHPADPADFNAFWGMVAVAEEEAHRLPDVVGKGTDSPLPGAAALMVERVVNYNTAAG
ncbi:hypothetical protein [Umezawaea sp. Da 62-37]|uniref:hypothetical protein n=1 Tax=Umezawaea sp. Da 62-37 TaxID=3075927 RepID=UPI0028F72FB8|nr:hypothetical protein [Umezawaea sp. Da 62-37]WNV88967.1 hypothetical protein RM788_11885 [Umezawaea sp. Da 62-37]